MYELIKLYSSLIFHVLCSVIIFLSFFLSPFFLFFLSISFSHILSTFPVFLPAVNFLKQFSTDFTQWKKIKWKRNNEKCNANISGENHKLTLSLSFILSFSFLSILFSDTLILSLSNFGLLMIFEVIVIVSLHLWKG